MNPLAVPLLLCVITLGSGWMNRSLAAAEVQSSAPCSAPQYRQFDFWLGDWDLFDANPNAPVARAKVSSILDGCVLLEEYEGADGSKGKSFSTYDFSRDIWHQTWVTNRGKLLWIEGHYINGEIVLSGVEHTSSGLERQVRGTWKQVREGVRETAVTSTDGGRHWELWFDLMFRPHHP